MLGQKENTMYYANNYGIRNDDAITGFDAQKYHRERIAHGDEAGGIKVVGWTMPGLRITRLRLLSDPGYPNWDVSYCHGELDGEPVDVQLPFTNLPKRNTMRAIVEHAKRDGVFAKGIGILDNISRLQ